MTLTDRNMSELADLIQAAKAQAWEEGYSAGSDDYACCRQFGNTTNPYKETSQ